MRQLIDENVPFGRIEQSADEALRTVAAFNQLYKAALIEDLKAGMVYGEGSDEEQ